MESPQTTEQAAPNTTLRDELVNALQQAETPKEEPQEQEEAEIDEGSSDAEEETEKESAEQEAEGAEEGDEDDEAEAKAEEEFPLIPNNWSQEEKDAFQGLLDSDDPDKRMAAEIMLERYNSFKKTFFEKTQQYAKETKEYKEINSVFEPVQQLMQTNGVNKADYIKNMMQWESMLARDPVNGVKAVMAKFGVKPEQIVPRKKDDFDFEDDDLTEDTNNVNNNYVSKQELEELRTAIANQPLLAQVAQFANATDSSGKLLHPRFEEVKPIMGQIIQTKKAATLEEAYRKAVKIFDDEQPSDNEPAVNIDKIRQKVKQARKAQKGVKTGSGKPDLSRMSIKEELMARMNQ